MAETCDPSLNRQAGVSAAKPSPRESLLKSNRKKESNRSISSGHQPDASNRNNNENLKPDCLVIFRTTDKYKGEFGFDWVRIDHQIDTSIGKQNYITPEIIGRPLRTGTGGGVESVHANGNNCTTCAYNANCNRMCGLYLKCHDCNPMVNICCICTDINGWSKTFKHDSIDFNRLGQQVNNLLGTFSAYPRQYSKNLTIKTSLNAEISRNWFRYIPKMTLLPKKTAYLEYRVMIKDKALEKDLEWSYDKDIFNVTIKKKEKKNVLNSWQELLLEIKCKKEFSSNKNITVYFYEDDNVKKICGSIAMLPNNNVKEVELLTIDVTTNLGGKTNIGKFHDKELDVLNNMGRQAYLKFKTTNIKLSLLKDNVFKTNYVSLLKKVIIDFDDPQKKPGSTQFFVNYLNDQLDPKYSAYKKVFFVNEKMNDGTLGYALGNLCVIFISEDETTVLHEILHMLKLGHTFMPKQIGNENLRSDYTYKALQTDNIMDYSHWFKVKKYSLFHWQWKILNSGIM